MIQAWPSEEKGCLKWRGNYEYKRLSRSATGSPRLMGTRYRPGSSDLTISISSSSVISLGALIWDEIQTLIKIFSFVVSSPSRFVFKQKPGKDFFIRFEV
jgi:hypothetical protein